MSRLSSEFKAEISEVENFKKDNLKKVTTVESNALNRDCALKKIEGFDQEKLEKVDTVEKTHLPSTEGTLTKTLKASFDPGFRYCS